MLKHIVMFTLKEEARGQAKAQNALRIKQDLEGLLGKIPELRSMRVGVNVNHAPGEWDLVLESRFDDLEALGRYQKHPDHVKAGEFIMEARLERAFVDYIE